MNIIENKRLVSIYPFLKSENIFNPEYENYDITKLDEMPDGWRVAFGIKMCEEIKKVLKKHNLLEEYKVLQIKEKFGELRWYGNIYIDELNEVIDKYTEKSRYICIRCGGRAKKITKNWISPWCEECLDERNYQGETFPILKYWENWDE